MLRLLALSTALMLLAATVALAAPAPLRQNGNDKLGGANGKDKLSRGSGKDKLSGGRGRDSCTGGGGRDSGSCERGKL